MTAAGGESLASQCGAGKGLSLYQSNRERVDSPKGSLARASTMTQVPLHESTRGSGNVEHGEKFPYVPAGLEGQAAAGGMC